MRMTELRDGIAGDIEFPANRATVVERIGDRELEAPDGQSETVREVLDRAGVHSFVSVDDVYQSIVGNLSDAYIGRKRYDDRGHNVNPNHRSF